MKVIGRTIDVVFALATLLPPAIAQLLCPLKPSGNIQPSAASGYSWQVVATGLSKPRGITFDTDGNLLVVEQGLGMITAHTLDEPDGCTMLNHGIEISDDGITLYGSSTEAAYSWAYASSTMATADQQTLVTNMTTSDHTTRTLLLSRKVPGMLLISRGSTSNIDFAATMLDSGHSQVKAFNLTAMNGTTYNFDFDGLRLGWGLRNDVGVAENPISGGIYTVENSADQLNRSGVDIHQNNPAEEMNFLGYLNGTKYDEQGANFGYPWCFTAWDPQALPNNANITTGTQFAIDASPDSNNENKTDEWCAQQVAPRLSFEAHMAPLDIKFNNSGREAWISWHGSWDRSDPSGYKVSVVAFNDEGSPSEPTNSTTAATDIFGHFELLRLPNDCFRPVAMAIDKQGRIFLTSDTSGEIYMIWRAASNSSSTTSTSGSSGYNSVETQFQRTWVWMAGLLIMPLIWVMY